MRGAGCVILSATAMIYETRQIAAAVELGSGGDLISIGAQVEPAPRQSVRQIAPYPSRR